VDARIKEVKTNAMSEKLKIGDKVKVFEIMNPRRYFKCIGTIKFIGPMFNGGKDMIWIEELGSCYHPDSVEKVEEPNI
jgi:hypothetical protein